MVDGTFVHISDTHLGYKQYGLIERENDFFEIFEQAISKIIELDPEFVIHSGDLFEFSRPPTKALLTAQAGFTKLADHGIQVYAAPGNHDIVMRKNAIPPHVLFKESGVKVISPNTPFYEHDGILIGGSPYVSKYHIHQLLETLERLEKEAQDYTKKILVLHQGIDKYIPVDFELAINDLPDCFDYYAMGHIHDRIIDTHGDGILSYAGSTEMWRFNELKDYLANGKGFNLVSMSDKAKVEQVNLKISRELLQETIKIGQLDENLESLKGSIKQLPKPPLASVTVKGGNRDRAEVYEVLNEALSGICLSLRTNYKPTKLSLDNTINRDETLTIENLVREELGVFGDEKVQELGVDLLKELSEGDIQVAAAMVSQFHEGVIV